MSEINRYIRIKPGSLMCFNAPPAEDSFLPVGLNFLWEVKGSQGPLDTNFIGKIKHKENFIFIEANAQNQYMRIIFKHKIVFANSYIIQFCEVL